MSTDGRDGLNSLHITVADVEGKTILEHPVVVYSYVTDPLRFGSSLPRLRELLHRMGQETNQGEIAFEFDGEFYRIRQFDLPPATGKTP